MSSVLKIYDSSKLESQKDGYKSYCSSIFLLEGDFLPVWMYKTDYTYLKLELEILDKTSLQNNTISVSSTEVIGGYVGSSANGYMYADKQAQTLVTNTVYRLKITGSTGVYYSEIFKKI